MEEMVYDQTRKVYVYEKDVKGGQIYNFYLLIEGKVVIDPNQKKTTNGKANWVFAPLSDMTMQIAGGLLSKPISVRMKKLKILSAQIREMSNDQEQKGSPSLKAKSANYNKLLITINQDILDRMVSMTSDGTRTLFKIIDFKPNSDENIPDIIKI